jgi:S-formylglutathione hydrolase FrmB
MLATLAAAAALALPGFHQAATGPRGGTVWVGRLPGGEQPGAIYLPPGFPSARRYPVVYLLHGMPGSPLSYVHGLDLAAAGDAVGVPFLAVAPAAGPDGRYDGEWAGRWEDELVDSVVPWVDAHLPTLADAGGRTLAGLSAGGFGAIDIGLRHPGLFGTLESWSGYFTPIADGELAGASAAVLAAHDPTGLVAAEAPRLRRDGVRFFLGTGPSHGVVHEADTVAFAARLRGLGLAVRLFVFPRTVGMYRAQLAAGLRYALSGG